MRIESGACALKFLWCEGGAKSDKLKATQENDGKKINGKERRKLTHPIMTGKHEMVSPASSIPEGVPHGNNSYIIRDKLQ